MSFQVLDHIYETKSFKDIKDADLNPFLEEIKYKSQIILKRFKKGEAVIPDSIEIKMEEVHELTKQNSELDSKGLGIGKLKKKQIASFVLLYTDQKIDYKKLSSICNKVIL